MADFTSGDLVRLKSGGPAMTVDSYSDDGFGEMRVYCVWFDEKHVEKSGNFNPATLEKIEPKSGGGRGGDGSSSGPGSWMGN